MPRFFGMEHSTMMFIAIISVGSAKAKRVETDRDKYKTMAIWHTISQMTGKWRVRLLHCYYVNL